MTHQSKPSFTRTDGMNDVLENTALSGKPLAPEIQPKFEKGVREPNCGP